MALRSSIKTPQVFSFAAAPTSLSFSPHERVALINLGCARNTVDSETILGQAKTQGARLVSVEEADTVIVNTCAFINDAKKETIDTLLALINLKKQKKIKSIIAAGCFSERYRDIFQKKFPEIDNVIGVLPLRKDENFERFILTSRSFAYLKICESCYNHCSFCAIPSIKGKFSSRAIESIVAEAQALDDLGFKEIDIIGQDITAYGLDIYKKKILPLLLKKILKATKNIRWLRLLYAFPNHITDDLLDVIAHAPRICKYLDIPLQHANDRILGSMNRKFTAGKTFALIDKIRKKVPGVFLRTAFIVGYPGETDKEFRELCTFVRKMEFERAGVFCYSQEEGTKAAQIKNQISDKVKTARYNTLMKIQQGISAKKMQGFVGGMLDVLIDEATEKGIAVGRSQYDAPEVDGVVYVSSATPLKAGDFVSVKVTRSSEYDLFATQ